MNPARLRQLNEMSERVDVLRSYLNGMDHINGMPPDFEHDFGIAPETAAEMLKLLRNDLTMQLAHALQEFEAA